MQRKEFITLLGSGLLGSSLFSYNRTIQEHLFTQQELMGIEVTTLRNTSAYRLRTQAAEAFENMRQAAKKEAGIHIHVVSSFRDFDHQNRIWARKYNRFSSQGLSPLDAIHKIIEYSTIPGTSRHHWGTDIDLIDLNTDQPKDVLQTVHFDENGPFCKLREWLENRATDFGFYIVYTNEKNRKGFKYEPWHYSYAPISKSMLEAYRKLPLREILQELRVVGSLHINSDFIQKYINENILDINPVLLA